MRREEVGHLVAFPTIPGEACAKRDSRMPWYANLLGGVILAYAFSPIDLIPDFIPVLGYLDDLILLPAGILLLLQLIPAEVMEEYRIKAENPELRISGNWLFGLFVVLLWLLAIGLSIHFMYRWFFRSP